MSAGQIKTFINHQGGRLSTYGDPRIGDFSVGANEPLLCLSSWGALYLMVAPMGEIGWAWAMDLHGWVPSDEAQD